MPTVKSLHHWPSLFSSLEDSVQMEKITKIRQPVRPGSLRGYSKPPPHFSMPLPHWLPVSQQMAWPLRTTSPSTSCLKGPEECITCTDSPLTPAPRFSSLQPILPVVLLFVLSPTSSGPWPLNHLPSWLYPYSSLCSRSFSLAQKQA